MVVLGGRRFLLSEVPLHNIKTCTGSLLGDVIGAGGERPNTPHTWGSHLTPSPEGYPQHRGNVRRFLRPDG